MRAPERSQRLQPQVYRITGAQRSLQEDVAGRQTRYLASMAVRTLCFVMAVVADGWLRWVLLVGAILLPYFAVVFANAGRERAEKLPVSVILRPDRALVPPPRAIDRRS